jgi:hypothetical protein
MDRLTARVGSHFTGEQEAEIAALRQKWAFLLEAAPVEKP